MKTAIEAVQGVLGCQPVMSEPGPLGLLVCQVHDEDWDDAGCPVASAVVTALSRPAPVVAPSDEGDA